MQAREDLQGVEYRDNSGDQMQDVFVDYDDIMMVNGRQMGNKKRKKHQSQRSGPMNKRPQSRTNRTTANVNKGTKLSNLVAF